MKEKGRAFYLTGEEVDKQTLLYRACGLEGIYLLNGYQIEEHDGEAAVAISDVDGLHKAIGRHIVMHRKALTPKEIRFLRNTMDLTQSELADMLGNNPQSVARWEKGTCEIPGTAEKLLRVVFLASLMSVDELVGLRDFLTSRLSELDKLDELASAPAQFQLFDQWAEKMAA